MAEGDKQVDLSEWAFSTFNTLDPDWSCDQPGSVVVTKREMSLPAQLQEIIGRHSDWCPPGEDTLRFLALATCGEAGELANALKKEWRGDVTLAEIGEKIDGEIVDIAAYAFMLAHKRGFDILAAVYQKLLEVEERKAYKERKSADQKI